MEDAKKVEKIESIDHLISCAQLCVEKAKEEGISTYMITLKSFLNQIIDHPEINNRKNLKKCGKVLSSIKKEFYEYWNKFTDYAKDIGNKCLDSYRSNSS